jgi:putative holliday junction resolvase
MKILAVDPGEKRIGLAVSDPTGTIARPLKVIKHEARQKDAQKIVDIAQNEDVELIIVGQALDSDGQVGHQARKSQRLADAISEKTACVVKMWDESGTTQAAIQSRIAMGVPRKKRKGHLDDLAASILLQDYLIAKDTSIKDDEVKDEPS